MYDIIELNSKKVTELRDIAKALKVSKTESLKKQELIYKILDEQAIRFLQEPNDLLGERRAYMAIDDALALVRKTGNLPVPLHIRNAPTKLMKEIGYGKDYKYAHSYEGNFVEQEFLPAEIKNRRFYNPSKNQQEMKILERLQKWWGKRFGGK